MTSKACPMVLRIQNGVTKVLAFRHPEAGNQLVKGTIESSETAHDAARRELAEESGLEIAEEFKLVGTSKAIVSDQEWWFFEVAVCELPDSWRHETTDDHGHCFEFFWHDIDAAMDGSWDPMFHKAVNFFKTKYLPIN